MQNHRSLRQYQRPVAEGSRQVAVLGPLGLGGVEPADYPDSGVAYHPPLDLAGRLLGANENDPQRAAALGDVKQDVFDGALALARGVLVELVEHHEYLAPVAPRFRGGEDAAQKRPHHEHLRLRAEVVNVDDVYLCRASQWIRSVAGGVSANQVTHVAAGGAQAADEGLQGAGVLAGGPERVAFCFFALGFVTQ